MGLGETDITTSLLKERVAKHNEEIQTMEAAIKKYDHRAADLKPAVVEYNELLRDRKSLRRELAAKQRKFLLIQDFLQGTTLFDARFPLFSQPNAEQSSAAIH